mmetsp:Transcript_23593/g.30232  ORF Transcript_23593/g.30232 Transcript_23593/m.30232 type:complete len:85 (-) Transcript_23593:480-734(-)
MKPSPSPMHRLNIGPAKHAVTAIVDNPFLDKETLAIRSCNELPKARNVSPMIVLGISSNIPNNSSNSTNLSAIESNQVAAIANP